MADVEIMQNVDYNLNQLLNFKVQLLASDPGSPADGQMWINTTSNVLKFRANSVTYVLGRLDQLNAPTSDLNLNSRKITSLATPTAGTDAATKDYVDAAMLGLDFKQSVRAATTAAGTLASSFENGDAIDGVTLATGDRILIKNQATASENGIYVVNASGAPTRATDFDSSADASPGSLIPVEEGTTNGDAVFIHTTNAPITLGTTALVFSRLGPSQAGGVSKFSTTTHPSATSFQITHNLNTTAVIVQVFDNTSGEMEIPGVDIDDANNVTLFYGTAPTANSKRIVVIG